MASVTFEEMQDDIQALRRDYSELLEDFKDFGDIEIFIGLDDDLAFLESQVYNRLSDEEEQNEILEAIHELRSCIKNLNYTAS